jgi:hypothetical protein
MRTLVLGVVAVSLSAGAAFGFERKVARSITCEDAKEVISRDGAVVLRFPSERIPGLTLYTQFVRSKNICDGNQDVVRQTVILADGQCELVRCVHRSRD